MTKNQKHALKIALDCNFGFSQERTLKHFDSFCSIADERGINLEHTDDWENNWIDFMLGAYFEAKEG